MRKLNEILRMHYENNLSIRQISRSVRVSVGTVSKYLRLFREAGLTWPLSENVSETALASALFPDAALSCRKGLIDPDWPRVHQELKHKG